jgi:mannose-6-phosphate isomerase
MTWVNDVTLISEKKEDDNGGGGEFSSHLSSNGHTAGKMTESNNSTQTTTTNNSPSKKKVVVAEEEIISPPPPPPLVRKPLAASSSRSSSSSGASTATITNVCNEHTEKQQQLSSSEEDVSNAIPIVPVVKDYAWGIRGMDSRVGRYAWTNGSIEEIDPDTPYAELWIGTHPSGPARLHDRHTGQLLSEAVGAELPFLFKILSAGKALSIQAHPDKEAAERLHQENPQQYSDDNHKPEMAIALTPFEAMCGFRRIEEISVLLKKHPEFANCVSEEAKLAIFLASTEEAKKNALQKMFESFMNCPKDIAERNLQILLLRLQAEQSSIHPHPHDEPAWERKCARAILRLAQQFPNDSGAMAPFFLNYLLMAPGESFFMAANEPHAYVAGEIIECMACSDNVVRAGLTPKFKDVNNLVRMLTYSTGGPSIDAGAPLEQDSRILRYTPPVPEFEVLILTCDPGDHIALRIPKHIPAVFVIIEGTGTLGNDICCQPGKCYYHPAGSAPLQFSVPDNKRGPLKVAVAHKNLHLAIPTTFSRTPQGSVAGSTLSTPYPRSPRNLQLTQAQFAGLTIQSNSSSEDLTYLEIPDS